MQRRMRGQVRAVALVGLLALGLGIPSFGEAAAAKFHVPVEYYKLPNGLRVVL